MCVCVCVCVRERERDRQTERQTESQREMSPEHLIGEVGQKDDSGRVNVYIRQCSVRSG